MNNISLGVIHPSHLHPSPSCLTPHPQPLPGGTPCVGRRPCQGKDETPGAPPWPWAALIPQHIILRALSL
jgi:hypothetical protein